MDAEQEKIDLEFWTACGMRDATALMRLSPSSVDVVCFGVPALSHAAMSGSPEVLAALLAMGADVNATPVGTAGIAEALDPASRPKNISLAFEYPDGCSSLAQAGRSNEWEKVALMLAAGADPFLKDEEGLVPIQALLGASRFGCNLFGSDRARVAEEIGRAMLDDPRGAWLLRDAARRVAENEPEKRHGRARFLVVLESLAVIAEERFEISVAAGTAAPKAPSRSL